MTKYYAAVGDQTCPSRYYDIITKITRYFESDGYVVRTRGSKGFDEVVDESVERKELFVPWRGFEGRTTNTYNPSQDVFDKAAEFHPRWYKLNNRVRRIMASATACVLGPDLKSRSEFVICWTPDAEQGGGTGQSIRVASYYGIPVFDLAGMPYDELKNGVDNYLEKLSESNRD